MNGTLKTATLPFLTQPKLLVILFLHAVDDLRLSFQSIGFLDSGHEVGLHHVTGRTTHQFIRRKSLSERRGQM